ncbi:MAG: hypothetical protein O3B01_00695 [Planctomycetota bacterium]|nr:hypothetical protein [Planctomycetota bacterium]MDA1137072.1 hypothetical protein [Planctomycetota bacterium]
MPRLRIIGSMEQPLNPHKPWMHRKLGAKEAVGGVLFTVGLLAFIYVQAERRATQPRKDTRACEDNAYRLYQLTLNYMESHDSLPLAGTARNAFLQMARGVGLAEEELAYIKSDECCCPEANRQSGDMGYVYVGGGLKSEAVKSELAIVFFCSHLSHQAPNQHSQLMRGITVLSLGNEKVVGYISRAVEDGRSGRTSYEANAHERLESELLERRGRE